MTEEDKRNIDDYLSSMMAFNPLQQAEVGAIIQIDSVDMDSNGLILKDLRGNRFDTTIQSFSRYLIAMEGVDLRNITHHLDVRKYPQIISILKYHRMLDEGVSIVDLKFKVEKFIYLINNHIRLYNINKIEPQFYAYPSRLYKGYEEYLDEVSQIPYNCPDRAHEVARFLPKLRRSGLIEGVGAEYAHTAPIFSIVS